ncbi:MAG: alpha/beta hydrolase [Alphaproteobacteria bacterium]|nr:alpha/beta hydrolase [Alphaproteobacteria bacterium]
MIRLLLLILWLASGAAQASEGRVIWYPGQAGTGRFPVWEMEVPHAAASVILLPGGNGGFGNIGENGPLGGNFLVRARNSFAQRNLNVLIMGKPRNLDLDDSIRLASWHGKDIESLAQDAKARLGKPVWLVGTSSGTVSTIAAAITLEASVLDGIVLTSSTVHPNLIGSPFHQSLDRIRLPVLMLHHQRDACWACEPSMVADVFKRLTQAPVKKMILVSGGANPTGPFCEAFHWHGFVGMEDEAAGLIADWIKAPSN